MKRSPLTEAATLTLLTTSVLFPSQSYAQGTVHSLPEVVVTGNVDERRHPQDGNYSEQPLGCFEVVTPSSGGNTHGGFFFARFAQNGIPVMPSLNDPVSANDTRPDQAGKEHQAIAPGTTSSTPPCR
jgi:hypothetical protein